MSFENDSMEEKSQQSTVMDGDGVDEGRLFYIPLPAGVQAQPSIQGVTVKLGTEGPQNKLVMSAKLVTKPPAASTIPVRYFNLVTLVYRDENMPHFWHLLNYYYFYV